MPDRAVGGTSRRDFLRWTVLAGAAVGLAGCGGSGTPQADTGPALDGGGYTGPRVEIRYWHGFTGGDGPPWHVWCRVQRLSRQHPGAGQHHPVGGLTSASSLPCTGQGPEVGALHVEQLASQRPGRRSARSTTSLASSAWRRRPTPSRCGTRGCSAMRGTASPSTSTPSARTRTCSCWPKRGSRRSRRRGRSWSRRSQPSRRLV